ncbi:MAG: hypothetical protein RMK31_05925, partial [Candidatus Caldarchaeum sp.]|nr:hypothetical protein [Candidatus Caldarchaeum sp.]
MAEASEVRIGSVKGGWKQALKDFFFGALILGLYQNVASVKKKYDDIFFSLIMGEFLGIPLLGNYFTLRIVPYLLPDLERARLRLLRDVDI